MAPAWRSLYFGKSCHSPAPERRGQHAKQEQNEMITITDKGAEKVHEFLSTQSEDVGMAGLGVGGRGLRLLVDRESLPYVRGSEIDYEESLQGAGFKVNNPNVVAACGCGSSFRVAEEEQVSAV